MTFELQLAGGRKVTGVVSDQHLDAIMEAFNGYRDATKVLIQGLGRYDRQDRLVRVQSVEHTALLDPLDVPARLEEFHGMKAGWLDGDGVAPQRDQLDWLAESFDQYYPDDLPLPHTYPTPAGGIEMEWSIGLLSVTLEIDLVTRQAEWLSYQKDSPREQTRSLDLATNQGWSWLIDRISQFAELAK